MSKFTKDEKDLFDIMDDWLRRDRFVFVGFAQPYRVKEDWVSSEKWRRLQLLLPFTRFAEPKALIFLRPTFFLCRKTSTFGPELSEIAAIAVLLGL
jgi:hypothetical protein